MKEDIIFCIERDYMDKKPVDVKIRLMTKYGITYEEACRIYVRINNYHIEWRKKHETKVRVR